MKDRRSHPVCKAEHAVDLRWTHLLPSRCERVTTVVTSKARLKRQGRRRAADRIIAKRLHAYGEIVETENYYGVPIVVYRSRRRWRPAARGATRSPSFRMAGGPSRTSTRPAGCAALLCRPRHRHVSARSLDRGLTLRQSIGFSMSHVLQDSCPRHSLHCVGVEASRDAVIIAATSHTDVRGWGVALSPTLHSPPRKLHPKA